MNYTYIYNSYKQPDIVFADFYNEIWSIIILCVLILTRGIISTIMKLIKSDEIHHHVHYSDEYSTSDLKLDINVPKTPNNSPKLSEFDAYENFRPKPKIPPRDALV